jgi:ribonuclease E
MKRMLINATQPEELRVALVDGQRLYDLDIESTKREQKKSNIYKCRVVRIEQSLEAAFVDYGSERHGFLPFKEIAFPLLEDGAEESKGRVNVKDRLKVGQEFIVQVEKEERGNKGAALTTFVSLAGRYLVLMPNNPRAGGVSRQIEGNDRAEAREAMSSLEVPEGMGFILRTAGVGKSTEELQWDLNYLLSLWDAIDKSSKDRPAPFLIYQESDVVIRAIRDYLRKDIAEIWVDDKDVHARAVEFMTQVMPQNLFKLKLYKEVDPLFNRYQIEGQIESAFSREVKLPSGGSLSIDHTEALISIDINSARSTAGVDIEETAANTNLEAADEIARQLRLRDLGGLIVIDFIDMMNNRNQRDVEERLKEALKIDRARVQVGRISRFGLLEMSRQRLRPSLGESTHLTCPRCSGSGTIRNVESLALSILRIIEEEAIKDMTGKVIARLPVQTATFLLNEKRKTIMDIEQRLDVQIIIVPNPDMETPHFDVQRVRLSDAEFNANKKPSYELNEEKPQDSITAFVQSPAPPREAPAVQHVAHDRPAPPVAVAEKPAESIPVVGFLSRIFGKLLKPADEKPVEPKPASPENRPSQNRSGQQQGQGGNRRRKPGGGGGDRNQPRPPRTEGNAGGRQQQQKGQQQKRGPQDGNKQDGNRADANRPEGTKPEGNKPEGNRPEGGNRNRRNNQQQGGPRQQGGQRNRRPDQERGPRPERGENTQTNNAASTASEPSATLRDDQQPVHSSPAPESTPVSLNVQTSAPVQQTVERQPQSEPVAVVVPQAAPVRVETVQAAPVVEEVRRPVQERPVEPVAPRPAPTEVVEHARPAFEQRERSEDAPVRHEPAVDSEKSAS